MSDTLPPGTPKNARASADGALKGTNERHMTADRQFERMLGWWTASEASSELVIAKEQSLFPVFMDESIFVSDCILRNPIFFSNMSVCDLGCGTGVLGVAASLAGARSVVGYDISPKAISIAADRARCCVPDSDVTFRLADWATLSTISGHEVILVNPPFVPGPLGGGLPKTSYGGYLGLTETSHVLDLCLREPSSLRHLILISLTPIDASGERLLSTLISQRLTGALHLTTKSLYGDFLPIEELVNLFTGAYDFNPWRSFLAESRYRHLDYTLFLVSESLVAEELAASSLSFLNRQTEFSGSWQARLNRYRLWTTMR